MNPVQTTINHKMVVAKSYLEDAVKLLRFVAIVPDNGDLYAIAAYNFTKSWYENETMTYKSMAEGYGVHKEYMTMSAPDTDTARSVTLEMARNLDYKGVVNKRPFVNYNGPMTEYYFVHDGCLYIVSASGVPENTCTIEYDEIAVPATEATTKLMPRILCGPQDASAPVPAEAI